MDKGGIRDREKLRLYLQIKLRRLINDQTLKVHPMLEDTACSIYANDSAIKYHPLFLVHLNDAQFAQVEKLGEGIGAIFSAMDKNGDKPVHFLLFANKDGRNPFLPNGLGMIIVVDLPKETSVTRAAWRAEENDPAVFKEALALAALQK